MRPSALLALATVGLACAGAGGGDDGDAGDGGGDGARTDGAAGPFDLGAGQWRLEVLSNTSGTISHDGALAFTAGGAAWAAWSEPDPVALSDQDIFTATRSAGGWMSEKRTNDTNVQNAFPSLAAQGDALHLAWNGYPEGDNDIYFTSRVAGSWPAPANLSRPFEGGGARTDWAPAVAAGPAGAVAVAWASRPVAPAGSPAEIRVVRVAGGAAAGPPVTVLPATGGGCDAPAARFDLAGALHVVAACGGDIWHATDAGGAFARAALPGQGGRGDGDPVLALGPDGATLHAAWVARLPCADGSCAEVQHAYRAGVAWSSPVDASGGGDSDELAPALVVDGSGRPIVAFHRFNAARFADVFVTWSEDGGRTWAAARSITPGSDMADDWFPRSFVLHPQTGLPHLTFEALVVGSDPLNTEVIHADYVPAP